MKYIFALAFVIFSLGCAIPEQNKKDITTEQAAEMKAKQETGALKAKPNAEMKAKQEAEALEAKPNAEMKAKQRS